MLYYGDALNFSCCGRSPLTPASVTEANFCYAANVTLLTSISRLMPGTGGGSLMLRQIMKILHQRFSLPPSSYTDFDDLDPSSEVLPEDVKEGHFVVRTANDGEPNKRFLIRLDYLAHPGFIRLLELAEEEFGLRQVGVLAVPCRSVELQSILGD
ncbi:Protein SMALL AUXIN UP-REGULATED RNA 16 [Linum perenne]